MPDARAGSKGNAGGSLTVTEARRLFAEARRRHKRAPLGEKRRSLDNLIKARTALLEAENARLARAAAERADLLANEAARKLFSVGGAGRPMECNALAFTYAREGGLTL